MEVVCDLSQYTRPIDTIHGAKMKALVEHIIGEDLLNDILKSKSPGKKAVVPGNHQIFRSQKDCGHLHRRQLSSEPLGLGKFVYADVK